MSNLAIETHGLVKTFGKNRAVDGVDLSIPTGGVHGVLGPNGAGKTTVIRMLATLLKPDAGTATVLGHDLHSDSDAIRSKISLTGQFASIDEDLTGSENLRLIARLYGYSRKGAMDRSAELLDAFHLSDAADRQVKKFSGGMRRRIDIAASIVVTPELIFLDEPTTGLDPRSRNQVWDIVRAMVAGGTTVLLTTQYLDEADQLADRISVIDAGRLIAEGTPSQLKASVGSGSLTVRVEDPADRERAREVLQSALNSEVRRESDAALLSATVEGTEPATRALQALESTGIALVQFPLGQPTLDEVFLALTGHPAEETTADSQEAA